ncbi:hypothetical protein N9L59_07325, partial [Luminiphilus sp.]|nr:hypothetical protein [Luminiphilus sp.]
HSCLQATTQVQLDSVSYEESSWLEDYLEEIDIQDDAKALYDHAEETLQRLSDGSLFGPKNLSRNLLFLTKQTKGTENQTLESRAMRLKAIKALQYLYDNDDLIPDEHGYLGLLDDKEIINHAIYQMAPSLESIDRLEASLKSQFKNLCQLQISQGGTRYWSFKNRGEPSAYTPSGYLLATASPLLNKVLNPDEQQSHIILTDESVVHCLLSSLVTTVASFEVDCVHHLKSSIRVTGLPELGASISLEDGAKYRFDGVQTFNDQEMAVLETLGKRNQSKRYMPLTQFKNWATTNANGRFRRDSSGNYDLNFAEICHNFDRFDYSELTTSQNIFLVCKNQLLEDLLDEVTINGHHWKNIAPTARVTRNLTLDSHAGAHEISGNKLFLVDSLGLLTSFLFEEKGLKNHNRAIVIVEGSEAVNQSDELLTLHELGLSTFIFCNETASTADLNQLIKSEFSVFKWDKAILDLLPATGYPLQPSPLITSWEHRLSNSRNLEFKRIPVQSVSAEIIFESLSELDEFERLQGHELSEYEVDTIRSLKQKTIQITRADAPKEERSHFISKHIASVNQHKESTVTDRRLQPLVRQVLDAFYTTLLSHASLACEEKWSVYDKHEASLPKSTTLSSLIDRTRRKYDLRSPEAQIISCFWPGKSRMSRVLSRASKLAIDFVLFEPEIEWLESYERSHSFYPPSDSVPLFLRDFSAVRAPHTHLESLEDIEQFESVKKLRTQLLVRNQDISTNDLALAKRTILLEPEAILFCSSRSHFTVLRTIDKGFQVLEVVGADIVVGDRLIFSEGSDRSVISEIADKEFLSPGERGFATQWRKELIRHKEIRSLGFSELQREMADAGIKRHIATIRHWCDLESPMIAPINHEAIIPLMWTLFAAAEVETDLEHMFICIDKVRGAHIKAAHYLEDRLIKGLSEELDGLESFTMYQGIQQFEVLLITEEETKIPYRLLSKPQP